MNPIKCLASIETCLKKIANSLVRGLSKTKTHNQAQNS